MGPTGSLSSLAERMKEKAEQERIQTEKISSEQLQTLSSNLQAASKNALCTMSDAMEQEITNVAKKLNQQYKILSFAFAKKWIATTILGLTLCLGMMLAGWGMVKVGQWRLNSYQTELAQLQRDCQTQRDLLTKMKSETWGLELQELKTGRFIVFPMGKKSDGQIWTVGNRKAIRME